MSLVAARYSEPLIYTALWTGLFLACRFAIFRKHSSVYSNRVVSFVHALIAIYLTSKASDFAHPFREYGQRSRPAEVYALTVSLAYFAYDTVCCLIIESDVANTAHHICSVLAVAVGALQETDGAELTECILLMEISNPFLHSRFLIKEHGFGKTTLASWNDALFVLSFFVCRLILGPFITYYTLVCPTASWIVKAGGAGIQIVSCIWFYKIARMAARKMGYGRSGTARDRTIST